MSALKTVIEGRLDKYDPKKHKNCIYFCIDSNTIIYNNIEYGSMYSAVPIFNSRIIENPNSMGYQGSMLELGFFNGDVQRIKVMSEKELNELKVLERKVKELEDKINNQ